jgi:hypothetical protein
MKGFGLYKGPGGKYEIHEVEVGPDGNLPKEMAGGTLKAWHPNKANIEKLKARYEK